MKAFHTSCVSRLLLCIIFLVGIAGASPCAFQNLDVVGRNQHDDQLAFAFHGNASGIPTGLQRTTFRTVSDVNDYFGSNAVSEDDAIAAICTPTRSFDEVVTFLRATSGGSATFTATPDGGGSVTLGDGTQLSIPAGALTQTTQITVQTQGMSTILDQGGVGLVQLAPEGLLLLKPATLTVPYVLTSAADPTQLQALVFSIVNPELPADNEISASQPANIVARDTGSNTITVAIDHFSVLATLFPPSVLITPHLPPDQLKPGDMIFALSGPTWFPGHVGLFAGAAPGASLDTSSCIESTPIGTKCGLPSITISGVILPLETGVVTQPMSHSFILSGTVYMGARRPKGTALTSGMRDRIIQFASAQNGACYSIIGIPLNVSSGLFSCVSLVVASYLNAGINLVPAARLGTTALLPYELYQVTAPVSDVTASVGQTVQIPVNVAVEIFPLPANLYKEDPSLSTLSMSPSSVASLDAKSRTVTVAPTAGQACQSFTMTLNASGNSGGTAVLDLTAKVTDFNFSQESPIGNTPATQPQIGVQVASACGIPLASASMSLDNQLVASFSGGSSGTSSTNLTFTPSSPLTLGPHSVSVQVRDQNGGQKSDSFTFTIQALKGTVTVNFDGVSANQSPLVGAALAAYLNPFGIFVTNESTPNTVGIINAFCLYGGCTGPGAVVASSLPNIFSQFDGSQSSYTLSFSPALSSLSLTRVELLAGINGITHPAWTAQAFDAAGQPLGSVGEGLIASFSNVPPATYTLTAPAGEAISSVTFSANNFNFAAFGSAILDNFVLTYAP